MLTATCFCGFCKLWVELSKSPRSEKTLQKNYNHHNKKIQPRTNASLLIFTMAASTHGTLCLPQGKPQGNDHSSRFHIPFTGFVGPIQETWTWSCLYVYIPLKALRGKKMLIYHWQWKGSLPQPYAVRHVGAVQERWLTFLITNPHALFCEAWANQNSRKKSNPIPANSRCPRPS